MKKIKNWFKKTKVSTIDEFFKEVTEGLFSIITADPEANARKLIGPTLVIIGLTLFALIIILRAVLSIIAIAIMLGLGTLLLAEGIRLWRKN